MSDRTLCQMEFDPNLLLILRARQKRRQQDAEYWRGMAQAQQGLSWGLRGLSAMPTCSMNALFGVVGAQPYDPFRR
jgi:hypothetical protein